ncbi:hypothetical protein EYF80_050504 [Liparis tanakae]|uniref:Uncharacterized protein n=1 Tax=Liparis tanakae TaxID=230148 RepID=A0A4Z2FF20_9TELE|nr:hypothetical protein EYF80_050504 [Liparis tanakae]
MGMRAARSCSRVKSERGVRTNSLVWPYATSPWKPCWVTMASTASRSEPIRWLGQVYSHDTGVMLPVGEARSAHPHVLHQAQVGHLVLAAGVVEQHRGLHLVGLYAAHVVRLLEDETEEPRSEGTGAEVLTASRL